MSTFGDYEPEDSWDRTDSIAAQIDNLRARVKILELGIAGDFADVAELDAIAERLAAWRLIRAAAATPREVLRADQLADDLDFVRGRL